MTTLWRRRPFGFTYVIPRHSETSRLAVECLVVCSCRSGAEPYDFLMYAGQGPPVTQSCGFQSGDFVIKLCETLPKQQEFTVYFDNWFTCFELQILLKSWGIWSVGTIRSNRLRDCELKSEKEMKKAGRGSIDSCVDERHGISVVRWMDSSAVQLSATHVGVEPLSTLRRWDKKQHKHVQVTCPAIVREYNQHMGGVDLFDMLMALYKVDHKSTKWYRRIFFWALNVAVVNGWLLYRRHRQQASLPEWEQMDLLTFTSSVSQSLLTLDKVPSTITQKRRGRPSKSDSVDQSSEPVDEVEEGSEDVVGPAKRKRRPKVCVTTTSRYDTVGHFPQYSEPKQRRALCRQYIRMKCIKCGCHLCISKDRNCFIAYHTE